MAVYLASWKSYSESWTKRSQARFLVYCRSFA